MTMDNSEVEKSKALITVELIEYIPNSVVIKTILKKTTGSVTVMSVDDGEGLSERTSAFDTYAQVIDGQAELIIGGKKFILFTGESIVIPAHVSSFVSPNHRFKMILTVIKSGYEI
jgi:quercetin dioxygenase-like cupin family protein